MITQVGAYRVLTQIGEGGMGSVWLAEHAMLGRRAAIKLLHPSFSARPEIVTRFFNEARAATAISDPGIVQIFDFGHHEDGSAYIVMELLDGETLDKRIRARGVLPLPEALRIMRQVASSLGAAHARGIIHRDLKPENIFLVRDGEVAGGERAKILDFGIAKLTGDQSIKTQTSAMMGTPMYMSPEQCRGAGSVDQRSDVYALGCVLFAALTGRPPFDAEGVGEIIAMHLREEPRPPSHYAPGIPPQIDALVMRCLAKDPDHRYSSMLELAASLDELRTSTSGYTPVPPRPSAPGPIVGARTTLSTAAGSRDMSLSSMAPAQRSRAPLAIGGGLAAVAAIVAIVVVTQRGGDKAAEPVAASAPAAAPVVETPPPAPPAPDANPEDALNAQLRAAIDAFLVWAAAHPGDPCPDAATLGVPATLVITCTDQPSNQIIGITSPGLDGTAGTDDDIASWSSRELAARVKGARWKTTAVATTAPTPTPTTKKKKEPKERPTPPTPTTGPLTPPTQSPPTTQTPKPAVEYDANGIPIIRKK